MADYRCKHCGAEDPGISYTADVRETQYGNVYPYPDGGGGFDYETEINDSEQQSWEIEAFECDECYYSTDDLNELIGPPMLDLPPEIVAFVLDEEDIDTGQITAGDFIAAPDSWSSDHVFFVRWISGDGDLATTACFDLANGQLYDEQETDEWPPAGVVHRYAPVYAAAETETTSNAKVKINTKVKIPLVPTAVGSGELEQPVSLSEFISERDEADDDDDLPF